jgi:hypothetical protein
VDVHRAVPGRESRAEHPVALPVDAGEGGVGQRPDAVLADGVLDPAAEPDLVVADRGGVPDAVEQVAGRIEVGEDFVEQAVGEPAVFGCVAENAAEQADQRVDHLAAEDRERVDEHDPVPQPGGLHRGRDPGDPRSDDADVGVHAVVGPVGGTQGRPADDGLHGELGEGVRHGTER